MASNVFISGASSRFGLMTSRALADAGHTVFQLAELYDTNAVPGGFR
jgi:NADP-dependent 3-hydroxy acid dehydrogenase YdfG